MPSGEYNDAFLEKAVKPGEVRNVHGFNNVELRMGRGVLREIAMRIGAMPSPRNADRTVFEDIMWGVVEAALPPRSERWAVRELRTLVDGLHLNITNDAPAPFSGMTNDGLLNRIDQLRAQIAKQIADDAFRDPDNPPTFDIKPAELPKETGE